MHEPLAQLLERTFSAAERDVIYRLIRGCWQIRHFAADPIPMETLQRILDAALDAPFVGDKTPQGAAHRLSLPRDPQAFHVQPKREAVDWRARRRLDSRIYTDIWGGSHEP